MIAILHLYLILRRGNLLAGYCVKSVPESALAPVLLSGAMKLCSLAKLRSTPKF